MREGGTKITILLFLTGKKNEVTGFINIYRSQI